MEVLFVGIIVVVIIVVVAISVSAQQKESQAKREASITEHYDADEVYASYYDTSAIAFLHDEKTIVLSQHEEFFEYSFDQIASIEIVKNGGTITTTNRGSQLVGAAVGGLAFGGLGAVVGALSGSKSNVEKIQKLEIRITVDDNQNPIYRLLMFEWTADKSGIKSDSAILKPILEQTDRLYALLTNAMRTAEKDREVLHSNDGQGIAGQIAKLWELKEVGALTEAEFLAEKQKLLSSDQEIKLIE